MAIQLTHGFTFKEFASYREFKHYHQSVEDSSHYEIIQGNQCLYFDFDGNVNIPQLVDAIRKRLAGHSIIVNIYSSSDRVKHSYHVVVKGVYFKDHIACGQIAKEVIALIRSDTPEAEHEWIKSFDASVYSIKRNLRLLGSRKIDSTRVKAFAGVAYKSDDWDDPAIAATRHASMHESDPLYMSMVICVGSCKPLEVAAKTESANSADKVAFFRSNATDLTPAEVATAFTLISDLMPGIFSKREVRGKSLFLKRDRAGMCPICERVHDNENGIVSLRSSGFFFTCLRDTTQSLALQEDIEVSMPIVRETPVAPEKSEIELFAEKMVRKYGFSSLRIQLGA
jgi:hypothetical protein